MRGLLLNLMIILLIVGSLLTFLIWITSINNNSKPYQHYPRMKIISHSSESGKNHRETINKDRDNIFTAVEKQDDKNRLLRSQLSSTCHGLDKAIITQANTPLGSKLVYDGQKGRTIPVTLKNFNTFAKNPFSNKTLHTCAVVGNGGILANSSCGKNIDSAQFVIRCNLPPLSNGYEKHVGTKTDLVTANPSIFLQKYEALKKNQHKFVENLQVYGKSLLLIPAFSFTVNTDVSLRAFSLTEESKSSIQTVFLNPEYLEDLKRFWGSQGLRPSRLSTGMMMVSLAMELCADIHLYGFWPFGFHPRDWHLLTNHYYDDKPPLRNFHTISDEFMILLLLHNRGMLRLHLDDCKH
ncbi:alpha-2,8-sialyltransferase 8F-like isoform X2 [Melanotaenia boesemani]|uniref:alpha-2,8-sialyltransferase 8F-like isoform X2 n=1 Tax=Melanotaenia boesemani TaxID=1250792 RepID=UPI001C05139E|nr:alpha-2,8-sialyltransferase 8F-like isoform X2 [Melanotaenia boesemani]